MQVMEMQEDHNADAMDAERNKEQVPSFVYRSTIMRLHGISSKTVQAYSKLTVQWQMYRYRTGVAKIRKYDYRTNKICLRVSSAALTESDSPFKVPARSRNNEEVKRKVSELNQRYMFVQSQTASDEGNYTLLQARVEGAISMMSVCNMPVTITGIAYAMLGTHVVGTDLAILTTMIQAPEMNMLEWRLLPDVGARPPIHVPELTGKLTLTGCEAVRRFSAKIIQHLCLKETITSVPGPDDVELS